MWKKPQCIAVGFGTPAQLDLTSETRIEGQCQSIDRSIDPPIGGVDITNLEASESRGRPSREMGASERRTDRGR